MEINTLHFPTIKVKNANIKQFNLNKIVSWVGLRVLAPRNKTKLLVQMLDSDKEMVNGKEYDNSYAWKSIGDNPTIDSAHY